MLYVAPETLAKQRLEKMEVRIEVWVTRDVVSTSQAR